MESMNPEDGPSRKKVRRIESHTGTDYISNLPDEVLGQILSRLSTVEAVRTSILSRNWQYKWTYIQNICITDDDEVQCKSLYGEDRRAAFLRFVDRVLTLTDNSMIVNFSLMRYVEKKRYFYQLKTWIGKLLSRHNVRNLKIYAPGRQEIIVLPPCFSDCSSFESLDLRFQGLWRVPEINSNCFSSLKSLSIQGSDLEKFEILNMQCPTRDRISLTFPVLEDLQFKHCLVNHADYLEICAPGLKRYESVSSLNGLKGIKICGSKLTEFRITHDTRTPKYVFDVHPSLSRVKLHLKHTTPENFISRMLPILKQSPNLNCLSLSGSEVKALVHLSNAGLGFPTFNQLKVLKLTINSFYPASYKHIYELFQLVPSIETLSICTSMYSRYYNYNRDHVVAPGILPYLKEVKFKHFSGESCYQVDLAESILKNVKNLKRMLVMVEDTADAASTTAISDQLSKLVPTTSSCVLTVQNHR